MLKVFEYLKLDERISELFNRTRAELVAVGKEEVWKHTLRVINNLYTISASSSFEFKTALIAAVIHDIGYKSVINGHEKASAILMKGLLDGMYDVKLVGEVIHAVESHECDGLIRPQTAEALALHDADMLDYCGEKGIINQFILGRDLGLSNTAVSNRIVKAITEGFLIEKVKLKHDKELKRTEEFFTNLVRDFSKERTDFINNGLNNV